MGIPISLNGFITIRTQATAEQILGTLYFGKQVNGQGEWRKACPIEPVIDEF